MSGFNDEQGCSAPLRLQGKSTTKDKQKTELLTLLCQKRAVVPVRDKIIVPGYEYSEDSYNPEYNIIWAHHRSGGGIAIIPSRLQLVVFDYDGDDEDQAKQLATSHEWSCVFPSQRVHRHHYYYKLNDYQYQRALKADPPNDLKELQCEVKFGTHINLYDEGNNFNELLKILKKPQPKRLKKHGLIQTIWPSGIEKVIDEGVILPVDLNPVEQYYLMLKNEGIEAHYCEIRQEVVFTGKAGDLKLNRAPLSKKNIGWILGTIKNKYYARVRGLDDPQPINVNVSDLKLYSDSFGCLEGVSVHFYRRDVLEKLPEMHPEVFKQTAEQHKEWLEGHLKHCFDVDQDDPLVKYLGFLMPFAFVARCLFPGIDCKTLPVLASRKNHTGKSTYIEKAFLVDGYEDYYNPDISMIAPDQTYGLTMESSLVSEAGEIKGFAKEEKLLKRRIGNGTIEYIRKYENTKKRLKIPGMTFASCNLDDNPLPMNETAMTRFCLIEIDRKGEHEDGDCEAWLIENRTLMLAHAYALALKLNTGTEKQWKSALRAEIFIPPEDIADEILTRNKSYSHSAHETLDEYIRDFTIDYPEKFTEFIITPTGGMIGGMNNVSPSQLKELIKMRKGARGAARFAPSELEKLMGINSKDSRFKGVSSSKLSAALKSAGWVKDLHKSKSSCIPKSLVGRKLPSLEHKHPYYPGDELLESIWNNTNEEDDKQLKALEIWFNELPAPQESPAPQKPLSPPPSDPPFPF